jgi:hypothetical protein
VKKSDGSNLLDDVTKLYDEFAMKEAYYIGDRCVRLCKSTGKLLFRFVDQEKKANNSTS